MRSFKDRGGQVKLRLSSAVPVMFHARPPIDVVVALVAGMFGLIAGSFANVVIYRLPRDRSVVFPPSGCPHCGAAIRPWQNIPVVSWVFLRGRCASCRFNCAPGPAD